MTSHSQCEDAFLGEILWNSTLLVSITDILYSHTQEKWDYNDTFMKCLSPRLEEYFNGFNRTLQMSFLSAQHLYHLISEYLWVLFAEVWKILRAQQFSRQYKFDIFYEVGLLFAKQQI